jgi:hypothetical protein
MSVSVRVKHRRFAEEDRRGKARAVMHKVTASRKEQVLDHRVLPILGRSLFVSGYVRRHDAAGWPLACDLATLVSDCIVGNHPLPEPLSQMI